MFDSHFKGKHLKDTEVDTYRENICYLECLPPYSWHTLASRGTLAGSQICQWPPSRPSSAPRPRLVVAAVPLHVGSTLPSVPKDNKSSAVAAAPLHVGSTLPSVPKDKNNYDIRRIAIKS